MNSLRTRLLLLVAFSLGPAVFLALYNGFNDRHRAVDSAKTALQQITDLAAINEAQFINSARQLLLDLSDAPDLLEEHHDCNSLMRKTLQRNPQYVNFGLIQLNGDVTCSAVPSSTLINLADRPHFIEAVKQRRFVVGNYVYGRVVQKHTINLTYPVLDSSGSVVAVVFAALDLGALDEFIRSVALPEGAVLVTLDSLGVIASRRPEPLLWLGKKADAPLREAAMDKARRPRELIGPDGVTRLHTFAPVGTGLASNLVLTIGFPTEQILAAAVREQIFTTVVLTVSALLALVAAWLAGERLIVRRVEALARTAGNISAGDLRARTGIAYGKEELSTLARAIDEMAASLEEQTEKRDRAEALALQANKELMQNDQRKDEFLAMLAHELRNPLAPIRNAAHILKMTRDGAPRISNLGQLIGRQVDHMTTLVDDLLDVSRVTRGLVSLELRLVDLNTVVQSAVEQTRPLIDARGHALSMRLGGEPVLVQGEETRLVQIVSNLLNNAAKYTPAGGRIDIEVRGTMGYAEIAVTDNGVGIDADLLPRVFELFSQAQRTPHRSQGGLGLGLALVQGLVALHGGTITAASEGDGCGSRFLIRLPRSEGQLVSSLESAGSAAVPGRGDLRVLVVDDNADAADTTAIFLTELGFQVAVEYTGTAALARAPGFAPRVCLLDIGLPDMDGYALVAQLRLLPQVSGALMVAVTGYGQEQDKARTKAAGFDLHLVKPVDLTAFSTLLAQL